MIPPTPPLTFSRASRHRRVAAIVGTLCVLAAGASACGDARPAADPEPASPGQEVVQTPTPSAESPEVPADSGIARETVDIVEALDVYWTATLPEVAGVEYVPLSGVYPYDPADPATAPICGTTPLAPPDNAYFCLPGNFIAVDRGLADDSYEMGDAAYAAILAHEVGHQIQHQLGITGPTTHAEEVQADCLAGAWMGWMHEQGLMEEGDIPEIAEQLAAIADPRPDRETLPDGHGSREERIAAFVGGFSGGADTCLGAV